MDETHALQYALSIAGTLLVVIWGMMRHENKKTEDALEKKASTLSVDELKAGHAQALRDIKDHFQRIIDRNHEDYRERIHELNERQDREVDWLKAELSKLGDNLQMMRNEQTVANAAIMQSIQRLSLGN